MMVTINDNVVLFDAVTMGTDLESAPMNLYKIQGYAIQVTWTGSPTGTFKLQASSQKGTDEIGTGVTRWDDISGASQATGGAAGSVMFNNTAVPGYNWVKLVYTRSSGTGTVTADYSAKG